MSPDEYVQRTGDLVVSGRHREAIEFSERHYPEVEQQLTSKHHAELFGCLEIAAMTLDLRAANSRPKASAG